VTRFEYAVLRFVPNVLRGEILNIGLIVFHPERGLETYVPPSLHKIKAVDGSVDTEQIRTLIDLIEDLQIDQKTPGLAFEHVQLLTGEHLKLSKRGWFQADNSFQYEQSISQLMTSLVRPRSAPRLPRHTTRIAARLKREFLSKGILGEVPSDIDRHKVVTDFALPNYEELVADFAIKNGTYAITATIDLNPKDTVTKFKEAGLKALTLADSITSLGPNTKRLVVYSATIKTEKRSRPHISVLEMHCDRLFNESSESDLAEYHQIILEKAGASMPL